MIIKPRIFYFGMVNTERYSRRVGEHLYVGAASGKMASVVLALRIVGYQAVLVSLPVLGKTARRRWVGSLVTHGDGFPAVFLAVYRHPVLRKLRGTLTFAAFAARQVRREDVVIVYNHELEYVLALLILRLRGILPFQDIEDAPTNEDLGLRGLLNRAGYRITVMLTSPRKIIVSNQLARLLSYPDYFAIQGIFLPPPQDQPATDQSKWCTLRSGGPLLVHFGGTLMASTGVDLFCEMVQGLSARQSTLPRPVQFIVTGIGETGKIEELRKRLPPGKVSVDLHAGAPRDQYFALLAKCHASLALKSPESEISSTTFPSKVVEIASRGLAVVTTVVSDVPEFFDASNAYVLRDFKALELIEIIELMAHTPDTVVARAAAGLELAQQRFSAASTGAGLVKFLGIRPVGGSDG